MQLCEPQTLPHRHLKCPRDLVHTRGLAQAEIPSCVKGNKLLRTSKAMMLVRLVCARASFTALSTISLPLLEKKKRVSDGGTTSSILSISSTFEGSKWTCSAGESVATAEHEERVSDSDITSSMLPVRFHMRCGRKLQMAAEPFWPPQGLEEHLAFLLQIATVAAEAGCHRLQRY